MDSLQTSTKAFILLTNVTPGYAQKCLTLHNMTRLCRVLSLFLA